MRQYRAQCFVRNGYNQNARGAPPVAFTTKVREQAKTVAIPLPSFLESISTLSNGEAIVITDCQIFGPPFYSCIVQTSFSISLYVW